jgi:hypothetical protein
MPMAQYSDGTEAKVGDLVFGKEHMGTAPIAGYVQAIDGDWDSANLLVAAMVPLVDQPRCGSSLAFVSLVNRTPLHMSTGVHVCHSRWFKLLHRVESPAPATP